MRFVKTLQETLFPNAAPQVLPWGNLVAYLLMTRPPFWIQPFGDLVICCCVGWLQLLFRHFPCFAIFYIKQCGFWQVNKNREIAVIGAELLLLEVTKYLLLDSRYFCNVCRSNGRD